MNSDLPLLDVIQACQREAGHVDAVDVLCRRTLVAVELLAEIRGAHCDKDSCDYNQCDTAPCRFCELYLELVDGRTAAKKKDEPT